MMRLALHLRVNPARYAFIPLILVGVGILLVRNRYWAGVWPEAGAALTTCAFFMSLLVAGLSGWVSARNDARRLRTTDSSGVRRPALSEAIRLLMTATWIVGAYVVVGISAAVISATTFMAAGFGQFLRYAALGLVSILFALFWGWLLGRLLSPAVAGTAAILSWFVVQSLVGARSNATPTSGPPWFELNSASIGLRLGAVLLLAIAVASARVEHTGRRRQIAVMFAFGAAVIVVVSHLSTTVVVPRPASSTPVCVKGLIEYCLWPEHAKYRAMVEQIDDELRDLPVSLTLPPKIVDYALSGRITYESETAVVTNAGDFPPEFDISEGSRWALARGIAIAIVGEMTKTCGTDAVEESRTQIEQLFAWLEWRLAGGGEVDYTTDAPIEIQNAWAEGRDAAKNLTEEEQQTWATARINVLHEQCDS